MINNIPYLNEKGKPIKYIYFEEVCLLLSIFLLKTRLNVWFYWLFSKVTKVTTGQCLEIKKYANEAGTNKPKQVKFS